MSVFTLGSRGRLLKGICLTLALVLTLGTFAEAQANSQMITVVRRLVVWTQPSFRSRVLAVLLRSRRFTVDGRSVSGRWLHGVTDRGTVGWISSLGFFALHPEVRLANLPILSSSMIARPLMPMRSGY